MDKLLCPDCGHEAWWHTFSIGCNYPNSKCECVYDTEKAVTMAQRATAIAHLREIGKCAKYWKRKIGHYCADDKRDLELAISAYRAVGILKERKP